jgi:hypothetical protein
MNLMLILSCYKIVCHYFSSLVEYFMYSHLPYFPFLLLCCAAQKMRSSSMKTSRRVGPQSSAYGVVSFPLLCPNGLVIRFDVINTSYTVYFTILVSEV